MSPEGEGEIDANDADEGEPTANGTEHEEVILANTLKRKMFGLPMTSRKGSWIDHRRNPLMISLLVVALQNVTMTLTKTTEKEKSPKE